MTSIALMASTCRGSRDASIYSPHAAEVLLASAVEFRWLASLTSSIKPISSPGSSSGGGRRLALNVLVAADPPARRPPGRILRSTASGSGCMCW